MEYIQISPLVEVAVNSLKNKKLIQRMDGLLETLGREIADCDKIKQSLAQLWEEVVLNKGSFIAHKNILRQYIDSGCRVYMTELEEEGWGCHPGKVYWFEDEETSEPICNIENTDVDVALSLEDWVSYLYDAHMGKKPNYENFQVKMGDIEIHCYLNSKLEVVGSFNGTTINLSKWGKLD